MAVYNVYGSQNEFVKRVTRVLILRMGSLGQNGPLRQNNVFAVARIVLPCHIFQSVMSGTGNLNDSILWSSPCQLATYREKKNYEYRLSPKNYNQTFSINSFQNCKTITNYLHFGKNPIQFGIMKKYGFLLCLSEVLSIQV